MNSILDASPAPDTDIRNPATTTSPPLRSERPIAPLYAERAFILFSAWCWAIIGGAAGINALVKRTNEINQIRTAISYPIIVTINDRDIYVSGILATTVCFVVVIFTTTFLVMTIVRPQSFRRTFTFQAIILLACSIWLLIVIIVETVYYAERSAKVSATLNGVTVPQLVIQEVQETLGITNVYRRISYLRIAVILPWFTFLFTLISSIILFVAAFRVPGQMKDIEAPHPYSTVATKNTIARSDHQGGPDFKEQEKPVEETSSSAPVLTTGVAERDPDVTEEGRVLVQ